MTTKKLIAATLAATLATASLSTSASATVVAPRVPVATGGGNSVVPWLVIGCAGGIIVAALAANARDNRQLTTQEAWSCGTLFWFSQPVKPVKKKSGKKKKKP
jgi:hypothetical protein